MVLFVLLLKEVVLKVHVVQSWEFSVGRPPEHVWACPMSIIVLYGLAKVSPNFAICRFGQAGPQIMIINH